MTTRHPPAPTPSGLGGGCFILASPDAVVTVVTGAGGTGSVGLFIPNNPGLLGLDVFFQWAVLDPGSASPLGIAMSQGGVLQI